MPQKIGKRQRTAQEHFDLLLRVARLHYLEGKSKSDIARVIGMSAAHTGRLIDQAIERGLVTIKVNSSIPLSVLSEKLCEQYKLREAKVVRSFTEYGEQKAALGAGAAELFDRHATPGASMAVGGGSTILAMVEAVPVETRRISISPTAILGRGPEVEFVDASYLALRLIEKCAPDARGHVCHLPPIPEGPEERSAFLDLVERSIPAIQAVINKSMAASACFVGLGSAEPVGELSRQSASLIRDVVGQDSAEISGGINYNYFDKDGTQLSHYYKTIEICQLKKMSANKNQIVVLIAGGEHKVNAIEVALRNSMANSLVTDEATASFLINRNE